MTSVRKRWNKYEERFLYKEFKKTLLDLRFRLDVKLVTIHKKQFVFLVSSCQRRKSSFLCGTPPPLLLTSSLNWFTVNLIRRKIKIELGKEKVKTSYRKNFANETLNNLLLRFNYFERNSFTNNYCFLYYNLYYKFTTYPNYFFSYLYTCTFLCYTYY